MQGMSRAVARHLRSGQAVQFRIEQRHQLIQGATIALGPAAQQRSYGVIGRRPILFRVRHEDFTEYIIRPVRGDSHRQTKIPDFR